MINHFPGMNEICRKDLLAKNIHKMMKVAPEEYNFFPKTWVLPDDLLLFQLYMKARRDAAFIAKPDKGLLKTDRRFLD